MKMKKSYEHFDIQRYLAEMEATEGIGKPIA